MPKKTEGGDRYRLAALSKIKDSADMRALYKSVHGNEPDRQELQRFRNRLDPARSNPGADMLGLCIQNLPELQEMTLAEFFRVDTDENQQK